MKDTMGDNSLPLLLEGQALMMENGRMALCIAAKPPLLSYHEQPYYEMAGGYERYQWSYEMFDEGNVTNIHDADVREELDRGGKVIIIEI